MSRVLLGTLIARHHNPDESALCVGAFSSPLGDPSPLYLSSRTYGKKGTVHILDAQSKTASEALLRKVVKGNKLSEWQQELLAQLPGLTIGMGSGDPLKHKSQLIETAQKEGIKIKHPLLKIGTASKTGFPDKRFGLVLDLGTLVWSTGKMNLTDPNESSEPVVKARMIDTLNEYERIGKTAIIAFDTSIDRHDQLLQTLKKYLGRRKFEWKEHAIENSYKIKTKTGTTNARHNAYNYNKAVVIKFDSA